jgi:hypothetical protein
LWTESPKIEDVLDSDAMQNLMFDDSFKRSRLYFEVLQMLRTFSDNIEQVGKNLQKLGDEITLVFAHLKPDNLPPSVLLQEKQDLKSNWEIVTKSYAEAEKRLLQRITGKVEEIKSLRDGVSSLDLKFTLFLDTASS